MTCLWTVPRVTALTAFVALGSIAGPMAPTPVAAQNLSQLSCGQLWYERNAIFARYGHCFQTEQAINTFGRAYFPPYGKLPPNAQSRVHEITAWDRRKGCN